MRKKLKVCIAIFAIFVITPSFSFAFQTEPTTLIFVRHAERAEDGTRNPPISDEGKQRAVNLFDALSEFEVKAIYSTPYKRTRMTATPTADSLGLEIQEYGFDDITGFLSGLIAEHAGYTVLIVGHSNTTPTLTNMVLGEDKFEQLEETEYGDMFIVKTSEMGSGSIRLAEF
ncbi:MAG: histidine phosphatase family protein [Balneolaceae bacterium]|nr:histidine phosphatase family protein [Balneolaceae bacterium]MBO6546175.1 histidine phosphatase family protein [Balneolaceae bacterium]MBO6648533.1 histidine phosphatase family protein [Balneolaceae bacterium]